MIAELGLAIEMSATLEDIALTIHAHPTLSEMVMEASEVALGSPIHIVSVSRTYNRERMASACLPLHTWECHGHADMQQPEGCQSPRRLFS